MSLFDRIKKIASDKNKAVMETYQPVSPGEAAFYGLHVVELHKNLSIPTQDDNMFNAANIAHTGGKRPKDNSIDPNDKPGPSNAKDIWKNGVTIVVPEATDPENFNYRGSDATLNEKVVEKETHKGNKTLIKGHGSASVIDKKSWKLKSHVHELGSGKWAHHDHENDKSHHFDSKDGAMSHMKKHHGFGESIIYLDDMTEDALSRLRVQRAKLKRKLKSGDKDISDTEKLLSLNHQIKNLNRASKVRDEWANAAERNMET